MDHVLGAAAFAVGAALDPLTWVFAALLAWCALPRWSLVAVLGVIPGPTLMMLAAQLSSQRLPSPSPAQWGAVAVMSVLVTLLLAAIIQRLQARRR
jgi:hypothetical protein